MNRPQSSYEAWLQSEDGGWSSPPAVSTKTGRVNAHGAVVSPVWKDARSITLEGRAYAPSDAAVKMLAAYLKGICADPNKTYRLSSKTEIGEIECQVKLDGPVLIDSGDDFSSSITFSIQLVAPDPRLYRSEWQTMATGLPRDTTGGLDFSDPGLDFSDPGLQFGTSSTQTGFVVLRNTGTAPAPVVFTLRGPLTNPSITTTVDGESYTMKYNDTLTEGEFVVINPEHPSVLLGGTASRRELLNPADFRGFYVPPAVPYGPPGELRVGLIHEGAFTETGTLTAEWRSASW
ncbi:phage tail family protein [Saccharopolyspora erythraea]|uniref:phage tail family protein n=1 Tax=Saccharopolyspora erythraea TaxID=1836 RepID=UPI001BAB1D1E|nr:phage tail family protein [Saccharopolyspora erythraea]QUH01446.1 phage tail family protein [Saccharopolyspora erythraea]